MYSDLDYDNLSKAIVTDYLNEESITLQDRITKVAQDMQLNPNEARRLLEKTNARAHLTLFDKRAGEEDRYVEFKVASPDVLMSTLYGQTPVVRDDSDVKVAEHIDYAHLVPDERETPEHEFFQVKEASAPAGDPAEALLRVRAALQHLHDEAAIKEASMETSLDTLWSRTKYAMTSEQVASRVLNLHGSDGMGVIARMRALGMVDGSEKIASEYLHANRDVDPLIQDAVDKSIQYAEALHNYESARSYLATR